MRPVRIKNAFAINAQPVQLYGQSVYLTHIKQRYQIRLAVILYKV